MELSTSLNPQPARRTRTPKSANTTAARKTCQCEIPQSVPTFRAFRHVRNPKVRRAKDYEQQLLILRDLFPEYTSGIEEQIAYARSQQERNHISDRDRVLHVLEMGEATCGEVAEDLKIPYATAYKILREFLDSGMVVATERAGIAGNKPYLVFSLP